MVVMRPSRKSTLISDVKRGSFQALATVSFPLLVTLETEVMSLALDGVKCTVDTCQFWAAGNRCEADKIEVDVSRETPGTRGLGGLTGIGGEAGPAGVRGRAGLEIGEIGGRYRRGVVEPEATGFEVGELGGAAGGGRAQAMRSEHTCCRTFRPRT